MYYLIVPVGLGSPCGSGGSSEWGPLASLQARSWPCHRLIRGLGGEESPPVLAGLVLVGFVSLWTFGLRVSGAHWLLFFQYISNTGGHLCFQKPCWVICAESTTAEKKEYLGASALWVDNALNSMLLGLPTGQLISWHFDLSVQADEKSQREGTPNLNTRFFKTYYLM